jgi:flagellar biosynthesis protein FlhG
MRDQAQKLREIVNMRKKPSFQAISITSGKGGVGKTSFTVNLAYHLQQLGKNVIIFDADLALANVDILLGEKPKYNLMHLLNGEKTINEIIYTSKYGIKFIPAASGFEELANLPVEKQIYILEALQEIYYKFDIMLIDTSAGISDNVINFCLASDKTVVLTTPDPTALADAYAISRVILTYKPIDMDLGVVVNMAEDEEEALKIYKGMNSILRSFIGKSISYYGYIRRDNKLSESIRERYILSAVNPYSIYSKNVRSIAETILSGKEPSTEPNTSFWKKVISYWKNLTIE